MIDGVGGRVFWYWSAVSKNTLIVYPKIIGDYQPRKNIGTMVRSAAGTRATLAPPRTRDRLKNARSQPSTETPLAQDARTVSHSATLRG